MSMSASGASRSQHGAESLGERRRRVLGPSYTAFYERPVHLVRGEGVWLYDADGYSYLDAYNNVPSVGHCHPHVVAALSRQAGLLNTHTRYHSEGIVDYGERLLATCPAGLGHTMFTCTGSEANDLAIRIARHATGGAGIVATATAYHGATIATAEISPAAGGAAVAGPGIRLIPAPDTFRDQRKDARDFTRNLQTAIDDLLDHDIRPAGLIIDMAFSSDGIFFPEAESLREAAQIIRAAGGLFIADEVQSGFGRLGESMWGFERAGLEPDIVTMGKPMGDGHPIACVIVKPELVQGFGSETGYFNTFGGNPVSAAVGMAVLDVIEQEGLIANAGRVGAHLLDRLNALAMRHEIIGDVRGQGLYIGVELISGGDPSKPAPRETAALVNALRERRILINSSGPRGNVLKIRPPLVFSEENANQLVDAMDAILTDWSHSKTAG